MSKTFRRASAADTVVADGEFIRVPMLAADAGMSAEEFAERCRRRVALARHLASRRIRDQLYARHRARLRAERKAGQLITKMKVDGERADRGCSEKMSTETTLTDLGISRDDARSAHSIEISALSPTPPAAYCRGYVFL